VSNLRSRVRRVMRSTRARRGAAPTAKLEIDKGMSRRASGIYNCKQHSTITPSCVRVRRYRATIAASRNVRWTEQR